jgi:hypothetical protein
MLTEKEMLTILLAKQFNPGLGISPKIKILINEEFKLINEKFKLTQEEIDTTDSSKDVIFI